MSEFWKINLGHVLVSSVFIFGLGLSWNSMSGRIDSLSATMQTREVAHNASIAYVVNERNLKFNSLDERTKRVESAIDKLNALELMTSTMANELKSVNNQISELRREVLVYKK